MDRDEPATEYDDNVEPVLRTRAVPLPGPDEDLASHGGRRAKRGGGPGGKSGVYAIALIVALIIVVIAVLARRHIKCGGHLWPWAPCKREGFAACGGCGGLGAGWGF